jgi:uncharacterized protein (TIRG00374 family)
MTTPDSAPDRRPVFRQILLGLFGVVAFIALIYAGGADDLSKITHPHWEWALAVIVTVGLALFMFIYRWQLLANDLVNKKVTSTWNYYFWGVSANMVGIFLFQSASVMVVRAGAITRLYGAPWQKSMASVLIDKLFDAFAMILFLAPAAVVVFKVGSPNQAFILAMILFALSSVAVIWSYGRVMHGLERLFLGMMRLASRIPVLKRIKKFQMIDQWRNGKTRLTRRTVLNAYMLTFAGQFFLAGRSWSIARMVGLEIAPIPLFITVALVQASLILAFTPSGLGFVEGAWFIGLSAAGVKPSTVTTFLVAHRILQSLAIGVIWLVLYLIRLAAGHLGKTIYETT